ncbi:MAG: hypothetical protein IJR64_08755 [Bacteroidales bacterium]|nr:hypothetical protein [Bacteroidales bacterium]
MKKILLSFWGLLACVAVVAQEQDASQTEHRHSIEFSFGGPAMGVYGFGESEYAHYYNRFRLKNLYEDQKYVSGDIVLGAQYNYFLKKWLSVGVNASWGFVSADIRPGYAFRQDEEEEGTVLTQHIVSVMPSIKARWFEVVHYGFVPLHFSMYSMLSAGTYLSVGQYESTHLEPAYEITFLGWALGGNKTYVFEDIGYGTGYFIRLGLGFYF